MRVGIVFILMYFFIAWCLYGAGVLKPVDYETSQAYQKLVDNYDPQRDGQPFTLIMPRDIIFLTIMLFLFIMDFRLHIVFCLISLIWACSFNHTMMSDVPARHMVMFAGPLVLTVPFLAVFGAEFNLR